MASLAMTRNSLALPWAQTTDNTDTATTTATSVSLRSYSPLSTTAFQPFNRPASSLRSSSRPLGVNQEKLTVTGKCPIESFGARTRLGHERLDGLVTPDSHGALLVSLTPPTLDPSLARSARLPAIDTPAQGLYDQASETKSSQISPLSRLSRLWSEDEALSTPLTSNAPSNASAVFPSLQTPFETYLSTSPNPPEVAEPTKRRTRLKPKPLQLLDVEGGADSKRARRDSYPDILNGRRDSFTFHLPSDLRLDSPSPAPSKNGSYGSSALLHSPQPRRPSLVLASEHITLADQPYMPCWGLEPLPGLEQQASRAASHVVPPPDLLGQPPAPLALAPTHSQSVPPCHAPAEPSHTVGTSTFRPKTELDTISAQPGRAGLVTVTSATRVSTAPSSDYPLSPTDVERIATLHNGRIPSLDQLAPPEHLTSNTYEPIVNTGNQGPMVVQAGDWRCGTCSFVVSPVRTSVRFDLLKPTPPTFAPLQNWRRRKICLRCFPYANDVGKVLTIQSQRAAHLATPPSSNTATNGSPYSPAAFATGAAHMRVASAPAYPLDLDMYQSGVPSVELAALARSTSYPPPTTTTTGGVPHRPATTAAMMAHYQPRPAYTPHDSHMSYCGGGGGGGGPGQAAGYPYMQAPGSVYPPLPPSGPQQPQPTHFPAVARPPTTPRSASSGRGPTFPPMDATFSYWGLHSTGTQHEFSPTSSSSPSATSAGEFAAKKRAAASASSMIIKSSKSFEQYSTSNGRLGCQQQQQPPPPPPKGFLLLENDHHHIGPAITTTTGSGSGGFCGFPY